MSIQDLRDGATLAACITGRSLSVSEITQHVDGPSIWCTLRQIFTEDKDASPPELEEIVEKVEGIRDALEIFEKGGWTTNDFYEVNEALEKLEKELEM